MALLYDQRFYFALDSCVTVLLNFSYGIAPIVQLNPLHFGWESQCYYASIFSFSVFMGITVLSIF